MNSNHILHAIGAVDENLLQMSEEQKKASGKTLLEGRLLRFASAAVILLCSGILIFHAGKAAEYLL